MPKTYELSRGKKVLSWPALVDRILESRGFRGTTKLRQWSLAHFAPFVAPHINGRYIAALREMADPVETGPTLAATGLNWTHAHRVEALGEHAVSEERMNVYFPIVVAQGLELRAFAPSTARIRQELFVRCAQVAREWLDETKLSKSPSLDELGAVVHLVLTPIPDVSGLESERREQALIAALESGEVNKVEEFIGPRWLHLEHTLAEQYRRFDVSFAGCHRTVVNWTIPLLGLVRFGLLGAFEDMFDEFLSPKT